MLFRRFGTSRLARTVCAAPTGVAAQALYGKMPSVTYEDYPDARLIILWGVNPSTSGIHLVPYVREAQKSGARLVVIDPRATPLARQADLHLAPKPGTDVADRARDPSSICSRKGSRTRAFSPSTRKAPTSCATRAAAWTFARAAADIAACPKRRCGELADDYARTSPALIRCGWGLERNRNGGNAAMSILALPAVGGKFGVRGGGYSMSNSAAWNITRPWLGARANDAHRQYEQARPSAARVRRPADQGALRLQLQSGRDDARSAAGARRAWRARISSPSSSIR